MQKTQNETAIGLRTSLPAFTFHTGLCVHMLTRLDASLRCPTPLSYEASAIVGLFKVKGEDGVREGLFAALKGLPNLPSGPSFFRDVQWAQFGLLAPPQYRNTSGLPSLSPAQFQQRVLGFWSQKQNQDVIPSISVLDLGCTGKGLSKEEITKWHIGAVSKLVCVVSCNITLSHLHAQPASPLHALLLRRNQYRDLEKMPWGSPDSSAKRLLGNQPHLGSCILM